MPKAHTKRGRNIKTAAENVPYKVEGTEYARIIKAMGDCKFMCQVSAYQEIIASLRGNMRNRGRVIAGDIVLVSRRDFQQKDHLDILYKYDENVSHKLERWGELDHLKDSKEDDIDGLIFDYSGTSLEPITETDLSDPKDLDYINFDDI